jgi:hypothetical protein
MTPAIPAAPFFANSDLWTKAANNLLDRAEGLLRDELDWRRARPCLMAEYFRLAVLEGAAALRPYRRGRYRHWHWRCLAEHAQGPKLCPFAREV